MTSILVTLLVIVMVNVLAAKALNDCQFKTLLDEVANHYLGRILRCVTNKLSRGGLVCNKPKKAKESQGKQNKTSNTKTGEHNPGVGQQVAPKQ